MKQSWYNLRCRLRICLEGMRKNRDISVRTLGVLNEIRRLNLPNTNKMCCFSPSARFLL